MWGAFKPSTDSVKGGGDGKALPYTLLSNLKGPVLFLAPQKEGHGLACGLQPKLVQLNSGDIHTNLDLFLGIPVPEACCPESRLLLFF